MSCGLTVFFFQKSVISLPDQLRMFKDYIGKLNATVGAEQTNFILANSLFFLVAGSNDIANTYYLSHAREIMYDISSYTDLMIKFASAKMSRGKLMPLSKMLRSQVET